MESWSKKQKKYQNAFVLWELLDNFLPLLKIQCPIQPSKWEIIPAMQKLKN